MIDGNAVIANYTGLYLQLIETQGFEGQGNWNDVLSSATGEINKQRLAKNYKEAEPYWTIEMPCGHSLSFKTEVDVLNLEPEKDIPCICGDSAHYFVRWRKEVTGKIAGASGKEEN